MEPCTPFPPHPSLPSLPSPLPSLAQVALSSARKQMAFVLEATYLPHPAQTGLVLDPSRTSPSSRPFLPKPWPCWSAPSLCFPTSWSETAVTSSPGSAGGQGRGPLALWASVFYMYNGIAMRLWKSNGCHSVQEKSLPLAFFYLWSSRQAPFCLGDLLRSHTYALGGVTQDGNDHAPKMEEGWRW